MKVYVLTEKDFNELIAKLDLSQFRFAKDDPTNAQIYNEIHRRFNYLVCCWMDEVKK